MATTKKAPAPKAEPIVAAPAPEPTPAPSGFMKPLTPSKELAVIVGKDPLPRTEVVKQMWVYIKAHNLQDATNKRMINPDAKLKKVFGKDEAGKVYKQVDMFSMQKLISKHLTK
ncbi:MAG: hypothetical protein RIR79_41 [Pseudomonadota bacterium]|jgi:chromatin remodeling complex protein RSC6